MTNFEWLKQDDKLLYKALECDMCDECVFHNIKDGCSTKGRKEWLNEEHASFKVGDVIVSKRSKMLYVCTHIVGGTIYFDTSIDAIENLNVNYGTKGCESDFELYKGWAND